MHTGWTDLAVENHSYSNMENQGRFRAEYYLNRKPLLVKQGMSHWPIMARWSKDYLTAISGDYECAVVRDSRPAAAKERTTLKNYFAHRSPDQSTLTLEQFTPGLQPRFLADIEIPNAFFAERDISRFFFFHSSAAGGTLPHMHGDAFNLLHSGTKEWVIYDADPDMAPRGYVMMQHYHRQYGPGSHVRDWFEKELPILREKISPVYHCIQEAGDIVYIPANFCHAVLNRAEVMGLAIERKHR